MIPNSYDLEFDLMLLEELIWTTLHGHMRVELHCA